MKTTLLSILLFTTVFTFGQDGPWTQKTGIPAEGRHRTTGWSIGNKGYIGLGHYNSGPNGNVAKADIWEYDPGTDSWTQKADYGAGATYGAVAFTIGQYAYVGAHVYGNTEFYKFDPIANTWTLIAPATGANSDKTAFSINGKGYIVNTNSIYEYDPDLDTWTLLANLPGPMYAWSKSFVIEDKAYLLPTSSGGTMYEFKPSTNQFSARASYPGEAVGGWSTMSINGKGYVVTGYISFLNPTSRQMWEYDPEYDEWNQLEELPGSTRRFSSSFCIGNKGYISTGTNGNNFKDLWEFDPSKALGTDGLSSIGSDVKVYPNPASEICNILLDNSSVNQFELEVYDMSGKLKYRKTISGNFATLNAQDFAKGVFVYSISVENKRIAEGKIQFI